MTTKLARGSSDQRTGVPGHGNPEAKAAIWGNKGEVVPCAAPGQVPNGKLTRAQAAKRTGYSVTQLRRFEGAGLVHPERVGAADKRLYTEAEVEALRRRRRGSRAREALDGELAAEVFGLLDAGSNRVDIVKQLRVHPGTVDELFERWTRLRGGRVVTAEHVQAIEAAGKRIGHTIDWGTCLVELFALLVEHERDRVAQAVAAANEERFRQRRREILENAPWRQQSKA